MSGARGKTSSGRVDWDCSTAYSPNEIWMDLMTEYTVVYRMMESGKAMDGWMDGSERFS